MSSLVRFGVSLDEALLESFDKRIQGQGYGNRSEAIRDLIRESLVEERWARQGEVVGALTLVYDHHVRELTDRLTNLQHDHARDIVSTLHVHLDHDNCLEVLVVRGPANRTRKLTEALRSMRGVKHVTLAMTAGGKDLK